MATRAGTFLNMLTKCRNLRRTCSEKHLNVSARCLSSSPPCVPHRGSGVGKTKTWKHTGLLHLQRRFAGGGNEGGKQETAWGRMMQDYPLMFSGISAGLLWGTGDGMAQVLQSQMSDKKGPEQGLTMNRLGGAVAHGA
jgi:hypothetical protein